MRLTKAPALAILAFCAQTLKALPTPEGPIYHIHPNTATFHIDQSSEAGADHDNWRTRPYRPMPHWLNNHEAEIVRDHELVITPSIQEDVHFPNPLLPTSDTEIRKVYLRAVNQYDIDQLLTRDEKEKALTQKKKDIELFNRLNICTHNWWFSKECSGLRGARLFKKKGVKAKYKKLKEKLMKEMMVEGYVNLGRELKTAHPDAYPTLLEDLAEAKTTKARFNGVNELP